MHSLHATCILRAGIFLILNLVGLGSTAVLAQVPPAERSLLITLYTNTDGDHWSQNHNWNGAAGTECESSPGGGWYGVICGSVFDAINGYRHVIELDLGANNLSGALPNLSGFTGLTYLDISSNNLTGTLAWLPSLTQLEAFYADSNTLTGTIPALSTSLRQFVVHNNHLVGVIPSLAGMNLLDRFDVSDNGLIGSLPDLSTLSSLHNFYVDNNLVTGTAPVPSSSLFATGSRLCPNTLAATSSAAWDTATGSVPHWYSTCDTDTILNYGFEDAF